MREWVYLASRMDCARWMIYQETVPKVSPKSMIQICQTLLVIYLAPKNQFQLKGHSAKNCVERPRAGAAKENKVKRNDEGHHKVRTRSLRRSRGALLLSSSSSSGCKRVARGAARRVEPGLS